MAPGQQQPEEPLQEGPYICEYCDEVWPSSRSLAGHVKAHKGKAPQVPMPPLPPPPPPAFGPGPSMMPAALTRFVLPPPPPPPSLLQALGFGQPVAPAAAGLFPHGVPRLPLPVWEPRWPQARRPLQLRDPVVYEVGGSIRMVLLYPNPAFWAAYRMGMGPPVELDFMGLLPIPRPESPSPSFASWLNNA